MTATKQDQQKYLAKLKYYRQKYGENFDPSKLPRYLHSIEEFVKGKSEFCFLRSNAYGDRDFDDNRSYDRHAPNRSHSPHGRDRKRRSLSRSISPCQRSRTRSRSPFRRRSKSSKRAVRTKSEPRSPPPPSPPKEKPVISPPMVPLVNQNEPPMHIKDEMKSPSDLSYEIQLPSLVTPSMKQHPLQQPMPYPANGISPVPYSSQLQQFPISQQPSPLPLPLPQVPQQPLLNDHNIGEQMNSNVHPVLDVDFKPNPMQEMFSLVDRKVLFTPCLKSFYANIRSALQVSELTPSLHGKLTTMNETDRMLLWRSIEGGAILACGQSLIASFNTHSNNKSDACPELENAELPILRGLRLIASQYGNVKCTISGEYLCAKDHHSDIRAVIRTANQIIPQDLEKAIHMTDIEAAKVASRSWLPTSDDDNRFYWILSLRISRLGEQKGKCPISPYALLNEFEKRIKPLWWDYFQRTCFPPKSVNRLTFLFNRTWTPEDFLQNLGIDEAGRVTLDALELEWPEPSLEHFAFNQDSNTVVKRVNRLNKRFIGFFRNEMNITMANSLSPIHQGSWYQISSRTIINNTIILRCPRTQSDPGEQSLAARFHPTAFFSRMATC